MLYVKIKFLKGWFPLSQNPKYLLLMLEAKKILCRTGDPVLSFPGSNPLNLSSPASLITFKNGLELFKMQLVKKIKIMYIHFA